MIKASSEICPIFTCKTLIPTETVLVLRQDVKEGDIIIALIKMNVPLGAQAINTTLI